VTSALVIACRKWSETVTRNLDATNSPMAFFGAELRRVRLAASMSQDQVGRSLNFSGTWSARSRRASEHRRLRSRPAETAVEGQTIEKQALVSKAALAFDRLRAEALPRGASRDLIGKVAEERWAA
jgi:hypothetical protein